jgi:tetratricopeptide (TPR) repeat protein
MKRLAIAGLCLIAATSAFAQGQQQMKKKSPTQSKAEAAAVKAMLEAQSPDDQIKTADELITKFSNTLYKSFALFTEADAYEAKNDHTKSIVYSEQALQADPKNFDAETLMANIIASTTKDTDLDKAEKLTSAAKYAKDALDVIPTVGKPDLFQLTDDQWAKMKNQASARAWQAMGLVASVQKKADESIADYEKGLALDPNPVLMLRVGRALEAQKKYDEALEWMDKCIASPDASAQIKDIATKDKARVTAEKAKG